MAETRRSVIEDFHADRATVKGTGAITKVLPQASIDYQRTQADSAESGFDTQDCSPF